MAPPGRGGLGLNGYKRHAMSVEEEECRGQGNSLSHVHDPEPKSDRLGDVDLVVPEGDSCWLECA